MTDQSDSQPIYDWQKPGYRKFEIGDVFSRSFKAVRERAKPLSIIAGLLVFLPNIVFGLFQNISLYGVSETVSASSILGISLTGMLIGLIPLFIASILAPAAMAYLFLKSFRGDAVTAGQSMRIGLSRFWTLLGAGILAGLGMVLGFVLFVIPGIILYCGWMVVFPVIVMERLSVTSSLSRSWELTKGHKWMMFVVLIVILVIATVLSTAMTLPFGQILTFDPDTGGFTTPGMGKIVALTAGTAIATTISTIISSALSASAYQELRVVKEGMDADRIADIFG